jgi:hypothetical protein
MGKYFRSIRKPIPKDIMDRYAELLNTYSRPPKIVLDNLPRK